MLPPKTAQHDANQSAAAHHCWQSGKVHIDRDRRPLTINRNLRTLAVKRPIGEGGDWAVLFLCPIGKHCCLPFHFSA